LVINVPNLRFGFNDEYRSIEIGRILKIKSGQNQKTVQSCNGVYPIFGSGGQIGKSTKYLYNKPSVCIGRKGTIDKPMFLDVPFWTVDTLFYSTINDGYAPKWIYFLFQTINWNIYNQSTGVPSLTSSIIESIKVMIPSEDEQEKISHFLTLVEERIEVQNKIINNLLSLKKTINNVLFEAYSPSIIFKECYLKAKEGGTPDTNNKLFYEHGTIPFAKIDDLSGKYIASTKSYISEKGLVKSSAWLIPAQSVLLSNGATIGECSITQCVLCTKQGIVGIIPSEIITSDFMYYFFKTNKFRKLIVRITTRGTMETAYIKDIEKIRIPLPKKDEQIRHAKIMNSFEHKIDNEKRILEHLLTQKKFFLNNLFI
jgi:type I restriction enzyme S subunit